MDGILIYKQDVQKLVCRLNGCVGNIKNFENCEKRCPDFMAVNELPFIQISNDSISRQAAFDLIRSLPRWYVNKETYKNIGLLYDDVMFGIDGLQSIYPEQKTGRWIDDNCSECGQYVYHGDARNYCPNCGALMKG